MIGLTRRAAADERGAAAIEFALILPVLFVLHVSAAEALEAYQAQRNVAHIASAMGDIVARERIVTSAELDDVFTASNAMIYPFPNLAVQQRISSLSANAAGSVSVDWTAKSGWSGSSPASVPNGYLGPNESVIVTDVIYDYKPTFGLFLPATIRFTRHAYVRPRLTTKVEKSG